MNIRSKLISDALTERFRELCDERSQGLGFLRFGGGAHPFAQQVRRKLFNISPAQLVEPMDGKGQHNYWAQSQPPHVTGFQPALFSLALDEPLQLASADYPPVEPFMEQLTATASRPKQRVGLLMERYSYPLNFTLPEEDLVREYVLTRVMSRHRSLIEKGSFEAADGDELMVMLNLIAVHATRSPDLRFLDALNYYYELLPTSWFVRVQLQGVLFASYFALYARALAAWIREDN
jgi:hypothetical protein